jgi:hypothetical protein
VLRVLGPKLRFSSETYKGIICTPLLGALQQDLRTKVHTSKMMRMWFEAHK